MMNFYRSSGEISSSCSFTDGGAKNVLLLLNENLMSIIIQDEYKTVCETRAEFRK